MSLKGDQCVSSSCKFRNSLLQKAAYNSTEDLTVRKPVIDDDRDIGEYQITK